MSNQEKPKVLGMPVSLSCSRIVAFAGNTALRRRLGAKGELKLSRFGGPIELRGIANAFHHHIAPLSQAHLSLPPDGYDATLFSHGQLAARLVTPGNMC